MRVPVAESALEAVVDVLIENVFAHTPDGTRFAVGFERRGGDMRVWVSDAGAGFDLDALERGASGAGSTGLGLDIARSTAVGAGGSFSMEESALGGVEVSVVLPLLAGGET